jgi:hypothetical protein
MNAQSQTELPEYVLGISPANSDDYVIATPNQRASTLRSRKARMILP